MEGIREIPEQPKTGRAPIHRRIGECNTMRRSESGWTYPKGRVRKADAKEALIRPNKTPPLMPPKRIVKKIVKSSATVVDSDDDDELDIVAKKK